MRLFVRTRGLFAVNYGLWLAFVIGCTASDSANQAKPTVEAGSRAVFTDVAASAGIHHTHQKPRLDSALDNIMPWMSSVGAAAAAVDYDRDGWMDLYVTQSRKGEPNLLYRNRGDGTFDEVGEQAGLARVNDDRGVSMDCVFEDYDGDGWDDLYLVRWGRDSLYRNRGDGTFVDVTEAAFGTMPWANGNAAVFLDFDRDGRVDVYVGNYFEAVDLWDLKSTRIMHDDFERSRNGGRNFLFHQLDSGRFEEVAVDHGVDDTGWTLAVGSVDLDNDGWPDLYSANDFGTDQLFVNRKGRFADVSEIAIGFDTKKGMNVDFGDFDGDGWFDIYVANITTAEYLKEGNMLWHNQGVDEDGQLRFYDVAFESEVHNGGWGWGAKFFDLELDGDLDLIAVNGFVSAGVESYWYDLAGWAVTGVDVSDARNWPTMGDKSFSGREPTRVWRNEGTSLFDECARELGLASTSDGRGVVIWDFDNDGDSDIYVANQGQVPHLYRNDIDGAGRWLTISLEPAAGQTAIGTRVTAVCPNGTRIRERDGGNGFSGQSDPRVHFGLGEATVVDLLEVRWPDGGRQCLEGIQTNRSIVVRQDRALYVDDKRITVQAPVVRSRSKTTVADIPFSKEDLDRALGELETSYAAQSSYATASLYRRMCAENGQHDRSIKFFERRVLEDGDSRSRIELSSALIDKIPTCGGIAAVVSKGRLAQRSLDQLNAVIEAEGDSWVTRYCRGMNHLHWPRALRHTPDAIRDLEWCLAAQKKSPVRPKYYARTHVALGDAHAKIGELDKAREIWRAAEKRFPDAKELRDRLSAPGDAELSKLIESERSLDGVIDTGLGFLDGAQ